MNRSLLESELYSMPLIVRNPAGESLVDRYKGREAGRYHVKSPVVVHVDNHLCAFIDRIHAAPDCRNAAELTIRDRSKHSSRIEGIQR